MKKTTRNFILLVIVILGAGIQTYAQEANKFRFDFDLGYAIPQGGGGGLAIYLEPKYNLKDNMSLGLRLGLAVVAKELEKDGDSYEGEIGASGSYVGTFDYYFNDGSSSFAPFIGAGIGYYSVASVAFDDSSSGEAEPEASGKFGGMIRGGFNWGKFKVSLDYNLVGKSDLQDFNGEVIGTTKNGYLGITLGFFLGGGKWGR